MNGQYAPYTDQLDKELSDGNIALGDLILREILQSIKSDNDYKRTKEMLARLDQYEMLGHDMVIKCADYYRVLRKKGMTIRKTADVITATFCIENKLPLLFTDRDFKPFVEHCGLKEVIPNSYRP